MPARTGAFGKRVRDLRVSAGLTQAELADAAGVSERTVSDIERGLRGSVYAVTARRLAAALSVAADDLPDFLRGAGGGPSNVQTPRGSRLPVPATRLVGRRGEVSHVADLVRDPDVRLVTLIGPGGVGKSRLAIEVASEVREAFPGGVCFVSLSAVDGPAHVLAAIAATVGIAPGREDLREVLIQWLDQAASLLVLDTFEHVLPASADIAALISACPSITVLVTSRSPLNVRGERQSTVQPLDLDLAVELFRDRVSALAREQPPDDATVDAICARLDGLPLAIELAAASTRHLTLSELRTELEHRLDPLAGGPRDMPARHRTMRGAIDWSCALLDEAQMQLFRCASVFRGSFDRDAAEAVAAPDVPDVREALNALVDHSLLVVETATPGRTRYRLLDLIRECALEGARSAEGVLAERHAQHFLGVAERAEPELRGAKQLEWFALLVEDEPNFRAAITWALRDGRSDLALRLAGALWMFWRWAGLFTDARRWLDDALASAKQSAPASRLQALWGAGWLAYHHGDYRRTDEVASEMLGILDEVDDPIARRNALTLQGNAALANERYDDAIGALGGALELCGAGERSWHLATSQLNLGTAMLAAGRTVEAEELFVRAQEAYEALGDQHFVARALIQRGYAALERGEQTGAETRVADALAISERLADPWSIAEALEAVATVRAGPDPENAAMLLGAADRLREEIAMRPHPADALITRAAVEAAKRRLTPEKFEAARAEGRDLPLELMIGSATRLVRRR